MSLTRIIVVCGPTASGKTALAVRIAKAVSGEVINCDSQQVYRHFEIGTARPTEIEKDGIPHHLFGVVDPGVHFNAAIYVEMADKAIAEVAGRGAAPVLAGGSGLYVRALTRGLCEIPEIPAEIARDVKKRIAADGPEVAYARLREVDPVAAKKITPADAQRIERALSVFEATGVRMSEFQRAHSFSERRYEALKIGIRVPRDVLVARIAGRTRELFRSGFVDEVRRLKEMGYGPAMQSFLAHGYRYCSAVADGTMSVDEAIELTDRDTRRYAKRQMTWLRADKEIKWFDGPDCPGAIEAAKEFIKTQSTNREITVEELLVSLDRYGYFADGGFDAEKFTSIVEIRLNMGKDRAIDMLLKNGLVSFEYDPSRKMHPKDVLDYWRVVLTEDGEKLLGK